MNRSSSSTYSSMIRKDDRWPKWVNDLQRKEEGLSNSERAHLKILTLGALRLFVNLRYPPDPLRYSPMTKKELLHELTYPRYG